MKRVGLILERVGLGRGSPLRKIIIAVIGTTILVIGIALLVLPGPAFIVIPIGLAILASEFIWARRVIERGRAFLNKIRGRGKAPSSAPGREIPS
jgi:tellurite resistance protein TerC